MFVKQLCHFSCGNNELQEKIYWNVMKIVLELKQMSYEEGREVLDLPILEKGKMRHENYFLNS